VLRVSLLFAIWQQQSFVMVLVTVVGHCDPVLEPVLESLKLRCLRVITGGSAEMESKGFAE
jgi:hypothetical protein